MDTKLITRQYRLQKWAKLIAERSDCGLTIHAFCQKRGISRNAYFYWLKRVRQAACQNLPAVEPTKFAPVEISPLPVPSTTSGCLTLRYGQISLEVYESTPDHLLKNTLAILLQELPPC